MTFYLPTMTAKRTLMGITLIKPKVVKILRVYGVKKAGIFGSYARGEQGKKSDIDILVDVPDRVTLYEFIGIKLDLEEKLGKKVDLVEYKTIRPELRKAILQEEVRIL